MNPPEAFVSWQVPAYEYRPKTADWNWALGIITVACAIAAFFFGNYLFCIIILLSGSLLGIYGSKVPPVLSVAITERGVRVDSTLYPYSSLRSFWVSESDHPVLILASHHAMVPLITIPLGHEDPLVVREVLLPFVDEEEMAEPLFHRFLDAIGF